MTEHVDQAVTFWNTHFKNLPLFHGTSLQLETSINEHGLTPNKRPYSEKDFQLLLEIRRRLGWGRDSDFRDHRHVYFSMNRYAAAEHAFGGSEFIREVGGQIDYMLGLEHIGDMTSNSERNQLKDFQNWAIQYLLDHKPLLLITHSRVPAFEEHMREAFPTIYPWIYNLDCFVAQARAYALEYNRPLESGIDSVYELVSEALEDFPVTFTLPSNAFSVVKGQRLHRLIGYPH